MTPRVSPILAILGLLWVVVVAGLAVLKPASHSLVDRDGCAAVLDHFGACRARAGARDRMRRRGHRHLGRRHGLARGRSRHAAREGRAPGRVASCLVPGPRLGSRSRERVSRDPSAASAADRHARDVLRLFRGGGGADGRGRASRRSQRTYFRGGGAPSEACPFRS